jgi:acyl dehydratase
MRFAQFHAGQVIEAGPHEVTEQAVLAFARDFDPQWFHADPAAAEGGRWGGLIASGWHTCAIAMRLVVDAALRGSESFASPGLQYVKWLHPVRPGDRLRLRAEVIEARTAAHRPELGILRWRWQLRNQDDTPVLELEATSLFDLATGD